MLHYGHFSKHLYTVHFEQARAQLLPVGHGTNIIEQGGMPPEGRRVFQNINLMDTVEVKVVRCELLHNFRLMD